MESTKNQGDKLEIAQPTNSMITKFELENRPVDADLEKKQGDPLFNAAFSESKEEAHITGKLARSLPEYHQGEARLLEHGAIDTEIRSSEVLSAQAVLMAENAKEIALDSKEFIKEKAAEGYVAAVDATQAVASIAQEKAAEGYVVAVDAAHIAQEKVHQAEEIIQEKAAEAYVSAVKQADTLLDKAYQGEQYLIEKAVGAEVYLEEKGKQLKAKASDILVHTIAPSVGYALGSAYVALSHAADYVVEKSIGEMEYLEEEAIVLGGRLKEDAAVIGHGMAVEAKHLKDEAIVLGSEMAKEATEKTKDGLAIASTVGKETLIVAAETSHQTMEYLAAKGAQTLDYLEKEAVILSKEGSEFLEHQKAAMAVQMEKIAEDAKHNPDAASLLRELADETEIKAPIGVSMSKPILTRRDSAEEFMKTEFDEALKLKKEHDLAAKQAAQKANFIQHEKAFEDAISQKLTDSLRQSHVEFEERSLEEGTYETIPEPVAYQVLAVETTTMSSPIIEATKMELKPLLNHHTQMEEPRSPLNV